MRAHQLERGADEINRILLEIYVNKTMQRLDQLREHPWFGPLFDKGCVINKTRYKGLDEYLPKLPAACEKILLNKLRCLSIIHGDFCLANVLFDPRSRIIKLVDPRGRFGEYCIYGDFRYELAKLSHSFNGHYEQIIHDNFFALCQEREITLDLSLSNYQRRVTEMFNRRLQAEYPDQIEAVTLIESLLFLSMVPLHQDFFNRQVAMFASGMEKYVRVLEKAGLLV